MKRKSRNEDEILQLLKMKFSNGLEGKLQIKEKSYIVTLNIDTNMYSYPKGVMNVSKPGISISSKLNRNISGREQRTVKFESELIQVEQLKSDVIRADDWLFTITINVRLMDIARADVRKALNERFQNEDE